MKYPSREYDELVQRKLRGNVISVKMTESETQAEIAKIQDGAISTLENEIEDRTVMEVQPIPPKRRGRPPGSKNRPKLPAT